MITVNDINRFWPKVDKSMGQDSCWWWLGAKGKQDYGNWYAQGKYLRAHRAAYEIVYGEIPDGAVVCHTCDNPSCVNPRHLVLGTQKQNLNDMTRKGRRSKKGAKGEANAKAKLTEHQVRAIRAEYAAGIKPRELKAKYPIKDSALWGILSGKTWQHIL